MRHNTNLRLPYLTDKLHLTKMEQCIWLSNSHLDSAHYMCYAFTACWTHKGVNNPISVQLNTCSLPPAVQ